MRKKLMGVRWAACSVLAVGAVLPALGGGDLMAADADNPNVAKVKPVAVIPLMSKAPKIDGVMEPGEWPTLNVGRFVSQQRDLLQVRYGEFWVGCDGKALYVAVRSAVHPQAGVIAKVEPAQGSKDVDEAIWDDSIEVWADNDPDGKTGKYYQFMVNSRGTLFDKMFDRQDGSANNWYRSESFRQGHRVAEGVWTGEFSVDLKDLEIADPSKPMGLRVCRNYKNPWDQSRWAPNVIAFDSAETMPQVRFAAVAPIVREAGLQDDQGINIAIELANPTDRPLPVKVRLGCNPENQPRYFKDFDEALPPGKAKTFAYKAAFFSPENYPAVGEILVTGGDGTTYYHRDFKWETRPKSPWAAASAKAEEATKFDIEWHPTPKVLRWRADFADYAGKDKVRAARLAVADPNTGRVVAEQAIRQFTKSRTEQRLELRDLPDGRFEARLFLDGDSPADKPVRSAVFHHASKFPWLNNRIGISDQVIPPFTPLEARGQTVRAVLREHDLTDTGLWKQVRAAGQELLAGPMRLEATQDGKVVAAAGKMKLTEAKPHRVTAEADWQAGALRGRTVSEFDYDGCMKVTLRLAPTEGAKVDRLELVIPLKAAQMPLMHSCGDGLRFNYAGEVPAGSGEVWTSRKASRGDLIGTFLPYVWLGGELRGLCWFAGSDRDWVTDVQDKVPALALERAGEILTLRVRLIQTPAELTRPHEIVYGLMATPARPMPANWRTWSVGGGGGGFKVSIMGMCSYWGGHLYGVFPRQRDFTIVRKITDAAKGGQRDEAFLEDYCKKYPEIAGEVRWSFNCGPADALVPYTNIRGAVTYTPEWLVYQNEWRKDNFPPRTTEIGKGLGGIDFQITPTASRRDFLLYYYREFLKNGFDGIYWDNICIYSNQNPVSGGGYVRPDGQFQPEGDIWALREVTKRTAVLGHELGKVNVNAPHVTNAYLVPVFSWTGLNIDWEWKYGTTDFQDRFSRAYTRAQSLGLPGGNVPCLLGGIRGTTDKALEDLVGDGRWLFDRKAVSPQP